MSADGVTMSGQENRRARLERARQQGLLVAIRRRTPHTSAVKGFVTALGRRWVAVAVVNDRIRLDGWTLLRLKEVLAVTIDPDPDCYKIRALKARSQWPVPEGEFALDDFVGAATSAAVTGGVVGIGFGAPTDRYFVGAVRSATPEELLLQPIKPKGVWGKKTKTLRAADIVRFDLADAHIEAYKGLAGPRPHATEGAAASDLASLIGGR